MDLERILSFLIKTHQNISKYHYKYIIISDNFPALYKTLPVRNSYNSFLKVYAGTYATANSVDSFCKNYGIAHEMPKLTIVFGVNMTLSILKDRALVKLFGTKPPASLPM